MFCHGSRGGRTRCYAIRRGEVGELGPSAGSAGKSTWIAGLARFVLRPFRRRGTANPRDRRRNNRAGTARLAIAAYEIAQRAAALFDRRGKRRATASARRSRTSDAPGGNRRPDARAKQALGRLDAAHADDHRARQQSLLDRHCARASAGTSARRKSQREWLHAQACQQRMVEHVTVCARVQALRQRRGSRKRKINSSKIRSI